MSQSEMMAIYTQSKLGGEKTSLLQMSPTTTDTADLESSASFINFALPPMDFVISNTLGIFKENFYIIMDPLSRESVILCNTFTFTAWD